MSFRIWFTMKLNILLTQASLSSFHISLYPFESYVPHILLIVYLCIFKIYLAFTSHSCPMSSPFCFNLFFCKVEQHDLSYIPQELQMILCQTVCLRFHSQLVSLNEILHFVCPTFYTFQYASLSKHVISSEQFHRIQPFHLL